MGKSQPLQKFKKYHLAVPTDNTVFKLIVFAKIYSTKRLV